jgi:tetratricopeptide (TPR) repeat protein
MRVIKIDEKNANYSSIISPHLLSDQANITENTWTKIGKIHHIIQKYDEAIQCFDRVIKIDENNGEAWYNKGLALNILGKYNEAIICYDQTIKIDENNGEAWYNK